MTESENSANYLLSDKNTNVTKILDTEQLIESLVAFINYTALLGIKAAVNRILREVAVKAHMSILGSKGQMRRILVLVTFGGASNDDFDFILLTIFDTYNTVVSIT